MTTTLVEIRKTAVSLAAIARAAGIPYGRLWRFSTGGLAEGLEEDELERLRRVLAESE